MKYMQGQPPRTLLQCLRHYCNPLTMLLLNALVVTVLGYVKDAAEDIRKVADSLVGLQVKQAIMEEKQLSFDKNQTVIIEKLDILTYRVSILEESIPNGNKNFKSNNARNGKQGNGQGSNPVGSGAVLGFPENRRKITSTGSNNTSGNTLTME